eukprot:SAG11_NODE_2606_length_3176_cov_2.057524_3_plen_196_part_00
MTVPEPVSVSVCLRICTRARVCVRLCVSVCACVSARWVSACPHVRMFACRPLSLSLSLPPSVSLCSQSRLKNHCRSPTVRRPRRLVRLDVRPDAAVLGRGPAGRPQSGHTRPETAVGRGGAIESLRVVPAGAAVGGEAAESEAVGRVSALLEGRSVCRQLACAAVPSRYPALPAGWPSSCRCAGRATPSARAAGA